MLYAKLLIAVCCFAFQDWQAQIDAGRVNGTNPMAGIRQQMPC